MREKHVIVCDDSQVYICDNIDKCCCYKLNQSPVFLIDMENYASLVNFNKKHPDVIIGLLYEKDKLLVRLIEFKRTKSKMEIIDAIQGQLHGFFEGSLKKFLQKIFPKVFIEARYHIVVYGYLDRNEIFTETYAHTSIKGLRSHNQLVFEECKSINPNCQNAQQYY